MKSCVVLLRRRRMPVKTITAATVGTNHAMRQRLTFHCKPTSIYLHKFVS